MVQAPAPVRTPEAVRAAARRRFFSAAMLLTLGAAVLAAAQAVLLAFPASAPIAVSSLLVGALLQVLGLATGATAALLFSHGFPLSESGISARFAFLASLFVVLPVAAALTAAYILLAFAPVDASSLVLIPTLPFFWGTVSACAGIGLVHAARELASERLSIIAAVGTGAIIAVALSACGGALLDPVGALRSVRLAMDLAIVAVGFTAAAAAFRWDAWAARTRRIP